MLVLVFHIIEWIRQTVLVTTLLVGVPWLLCYNILALNIPFGIIVSMVGGINGFSSDPTCIAAQPGRALFLQLQLVTFFLYPLWC